MRRVLDMWVAGVPVTKGSVNVNRGGTGVRQAAKGYAAWSDAVRRAARDDLVNAPRPVQRGEAALVDCNFFVPRPLAADSYGGLWAPGVGDGDKLERSVWDALTKAYVWTDDAQVLPWLGGRWWADMIRTPGVHVRVAALSAGEAALLRGKAFAASQDAYDRWKYGTGAARTGQ